MILDFSLALLLSFLTASIIIVLFVKDACRSNTSYIISFVLIGMFLSYVVAPISVAIFNVGDLGYVDYSNNSFLVCCAVIAVFFIAFFLGEFACCSRTHKYYFSVSSNVDHRKLVFAIFLISLVSFLMFVYLYGGFSYVIENISKIRSGTDDNKNYLGAFLRMFTYYILFVAFYIFAKFLIDSKGLMSFSFLFFCSIFLLTLFKSFLDGGRGGLIINVIGLVFVYNLIYRRLPLIFIFFSLPILLFVILFGKGFLFQVFSGSDLSFDFYDSVLVGFENFISNYLHQYMSMNVAVEKSVYGDRMFMDFVYLFVKPLKLFSFDVPDSISYFNTFQVKGAWDSEVPPGIILFALYQGGVIFVPIVGFFSGYFLRWVDIFITKSVSRTRGVRETSFVTSVSVILIIYLPFAYGNSDPALFVQWMFCYLVLFSFLYIFRVIKLKRCQGGA